MDLERINLSLRPRGEWEAIDLGLRLAQRHAGVLYRAWFMSSAPVALLIGVGFIHFGTPIAAYFVFWLLKPLFDRVLLHLCGRLIFDDQPSRSELRRISWRMPFQAAWWRAITWGRLDFSRSFTLPVWQLEGLRGAARSRRAGVLGLGSGGAAIMLSLGALAAVALLYLAMMAFVMSFLVSGIVLFDVWSLDEYLGAIYDAIAAGGPLLAWVSFIVYYACEAILAPLYVGAGFCLYLNRRTHIEAWDVELQFRRAVKRRSLSASASLVALTAACFLHAVATPQVFAQDDPPTQDQSRDARLEVRDAISDILEDPEFGRTVKRKTWREKAKEEADPEVVHEQDNERGRSLLSVFFGSLTEVILWSLLLVGLVALLLSRERWLPLLRGERGGRRREPGSVGGLVMHEQDLPDDLPSRVLELWRAGRQREATSLLYRGTLTILNERHDSTLR